MTEQNLKTLGLILSTATGIMAFLKLIFVPLKNAYGRWRIKNPPFKRTVLRQLEKLSTELESNRLEYEDYFAALIRERLESAYTIYVLRLGWCPIGEKSMLMELFDMYSAKGFNHLSVNYKEKIQALPESEAEKNERTERL